MEDWKIHGSTALFGTKPVKFSFLALAARPSPSCIPCPSPWNCQISRCRAWSRLWYSGVDCTKYELESMDKPANDYWGSWGVSSECHFKSSGHLRMFAPIVSACCYCVNFSGLRFALWIISDPSFFHWSLPLILTLHFNKNKRSEHEYENLSAWYKREKNLNMFSPRFEFFY